MNIDFSQTTDARNQIDYLFLIEKAIKAPSGHNSQAWLFKIKENSIEIHPNFEKSLAVVDPDNRELFVSLGCAAENLSLASSARGYKARIDITKESVVELKFNSDTICSEDTTLYNQIELRQTNRSVFEGRMIPDNTMSQLRSIKIEDAVNIHMYENGSDDFKLISNYITRGNEIQMQDKAFRSELYRWIRFNKKHSESTNDGLSYAVFGAPNLPKFIAKPIIRFSINKRTQIKNDQKKISSASHFVLFSTRKNDIEEWIKLGRTLQRFLLKSTELGIAHSYFNQVNEIRELSLEMSAALRLDKEYPAILLRIGYGDKMPYSKRRNVQTMIVK